MPHATATDTLHMPTSRRECGRVGVRYYANAIFHGQLPPLQTATRQYPERYLPVIAVLPVAGPSLSDTSKGWPFLERGGQAKSGFVGEPLAGQDGWISRQEPGPLLGGPRLGRHSAIPPAQAGTCHHYILEPASVRVREKQ